MKNTRYIIYKALLRMEEDSAYSNIVLDEVLSDRELDKRDKAFISNIFYGVLERRITLDYIIRSFSSVRLKKIEPKVLIILRMSVYQLVFMDKVPDNAAVNEAVSLCKKEKLYRSSGFVNGLLRSLTRADNRFPLPDSADTVKYFSVKYSCPESIVSQWINDYSQDIAEAVLKSLSGRPPIYIRVNSLKTNSDELIEMLKSEGVTAEKACLPNALSVVNSGSVAELEAYKNGLFYVQDLSSQICCAVAGVKTEDTVADVCAAPGGKSLTLAQYAVNGEVFSYDVYEHKISLISASAKRLGINNISAAVRDACDFSQSLPMSDVILCDVPCSGLGVLRRKPEIRYKEDIGTVSLPDIQLSILENSSRFVKPGGILVYSTCTLCRRENNENTERFLSKHPEFEPLKIELPDGISRTVSEADNCLTLFPQTNDTDGFFTALFRRKEKAQ